VSDLRQQPGRDVNVMGSAQLVRTLLAHDLVDELSLMIEPIVLGGGKRLFPEDGRSRTLELVSTVTSGTGVIICTYRPVGAP
jgi:dihydrofolate reductase